MNTECKEVDHLTAADFDAHPVWGFSFDESVSDTLVCPVSPLPVDSMDSRLVACKVSLANGDKFDAFLDCVYLDNAQATKHYLVLCVFRNGKRFDLARYHDFDREGNGPNALAAFLEMSVEDVFPIAYDISSLCIGNQDVVRGRILAEPDERLNGEQLMKLLSPHSPDDFAVWLSTSTRFAL